MIERDPLDVERRAFWESAYEIGFAIAVGVAAGVAAGVFIAAAFVVLVKII